MPIGAAAIIAGGGLLSGILGSSAATSAANTQAQSAQNALRLQQQEFAQTQQNLYPFLAGGQAAAGAERSLLGINATTGQYTPGAPLNTTAQQMFGNAPQLGQLPTFQGLNYNMPAFTAAQYQQSPGYQFELQQGIGAIQNSAAGKTGAISGNMLRGLQTYGTGLANQDFQQAYQNYQQNYQNQYNANEQNALARYNAGVQNTLLPFNAANTGYQENVGNYNQGQNNLFTMLNALSTQGAGQGANLGQLGGAYATNAGGNIIGAGNAIAAGQIGSTNALLGGSQSALTQLLAPNTTNNSSLLNYLLGNTGGTGGAGGATGYGGGPGGGTDFGAADYTYSGGY